MKNLLTDIREDMPVYDRENNKIGTVEEIRFGDEDLERPGAETSTAQKAKVVGNTLVDDIARAIRVDDRLPEEIRSRLQRYGYVKIDTGLLTSDRYVIADQIEKVSADRINLKVGQDDLITT